jgi:ABC-type Zn uptake system ZnuABC Zn-binding protein ZnuA
LLEIRLRRLLPAAEAAGLGERRRRLEERLGELERRLGAFIQTKRQRALLVHHPAFGVLAEELGLVQCAVQEDGREPLGRSLRAILHWVAQESIGSVLVARGSRPSSIRVLARQAKLEIVEYSVLESDWFAMMEELYRTLDRALR